MFHGVIQKITLAQFFLRHGVGYFAADVSILSFSQPNLWRRSVDRNQTLPRIWRMDDDPDY